MLLGKHLLQATKENILWGEYVDFFSLMYHELQKKDKELMEDKEKEIWKKRKAGHRPTGFLDFGSMLG